MASNIVYRDTGCAEATEYLGRQSRCLECPFEKCLGEAAFVNPDKARRNEQIRQLCKQSHPMKELAQRFGLSHRTVSRVCYER